MRHARSLAAMAAALLLAAPAAAGNKLVGAGQPVAVAKSGLTVTPPSEWNRLAVRPGRNAERWTLDGAELNDLTFYGGIAPGTALFREVDKRNKPLPRMSATLLITDVPTLLENSYRVALGTPSFRIEAMAPARFAGVAGLRFTYSFTRPQEDLPRLGEARAAIVAGKLYMITFEAPRLHFFDAGIAAARAVADSARL